MKVLKPVNMSVINDDYQDAQVLGQTENYVELEIICYPLNKIAASIGATMELKRESSITRDSLRPGLTTIWDNEMQNDMVAAKEIPSSYAGELSGGPNSWRVDHPSDVLWQRHRLLGMDG